MAGPTLDPSSAAGRQRLLAEAREEPQSAAHVSDYWKLAIAPVKGRAASLMV